MAALGFGEHNLPKPTVPSPMKAALLREASRLLMEEHESHSLFFSLGKTVLLSKSPFKVLVPLPGYLHLFPDCPFFFG